MLSLKPWFSKIKKIPAIYHSIIPFILIIPVGLWNARLLGGSHVLIDDLFKNNLGIHAATSWSFVLIPILLFAIRFIFSMLSYGSSIFNLTFAQEFGTATPWLGALVGAIFGLIFSLLHAFATINLHADHIISGTVLNLLAPPLGVFLIKAIYEKGQTPNITANFGYTNIPGLADIPVIGKIFFTNTSAPAWLAIIITVLLWWILYKTRIGLRLRSTGENPQAADTLGVNVYKMRYIGVLISGFMAGLGGAVFAQSISGNFSISTIVGQGFMALAAVIFGKWNPIGAMLSSLFFGFAQSLSIIGNQLPGFEKPQRFICKSLHMSSQSLS